MKNQSNAKTGFGKSGSKFRLLDNTSSEGQEFNRGSRVLAVLCKTDGRSFNSNVHYGRTSQTFRLLIETEKSFPSTIIQNNIIRMKTASKNALEPHEEDLTHGRTDTYADMEQRRGFCGHGRHQRLGRKMPITLEHVTLLFFIQLKRTHQAVLIPAANGP